MKDFILLMHADTQRPERDEDWEAYIGQLIEAGCFQGGSAVGRGDTFRKTGMAAPLTDQLTGFIRIQVKSLEEAKKVLAGNPTYEAGGTVEVRELVVT